MQPLSGATGKEILPATPVPATEAATVWHHDRDTPTILALTVLAGIALIDSLKPFGELLGR